MTPVPLCLLRTSRGDELSLLGVLAEAFRLLAVAEEGDRFNVFLALGESRAQKPEFAAAGATWKNSYLRLVCQATMDGDDDHSISPFRRAGEPMR